MRNVILCCLFIYYLIRYPWFSYFLYINLLFGRLALSAIRLCLAGLEPAPPTTAPALPIQLSYRHNLWIKKVLSYGTVLFQYTWQDSNLHHGYDYPDFRTNIFYFFKYMQSGKVLLPFCNVYICFF